MEKEDEDDVLLKDVYDVIPYYLKQIFIIAPLTMKKLYRAIPLKNREIAERNRVIVGALAFYLVYGIWVRLFYIFGPISQLLTKLIQFKFDIDRNRIIDNYFIFLKGESFTQQWGNPSGIIPEVLLTVVFLSFRFVLIFFIIYYYVKHILKRDFNYIGFKKPWEDKRGIAFAIIFNLYIFLFFLMVMAAFKDIAIEYKLTLRNIYYSQGIDLLIGIPIPFLYYFTYALIEEVVYRGVVQTAFIDKIGVLRGLILTSILFALSHTQYYSTPLRLLSTFLASLMLGYLYLRKRNLSSPVILHFLYNFIL
jgi:hypothetical protein